MRIITFIFILLGIVCKSQTYPDSIIVDGMFNIKLMPVTRNMHNSIILGSTPSFNIGDLDSINEVFRVTDINSTITLDSDTTKGLSLSDDMYSDYGFDLWYTIDYEGSQTIDQVIAAYETSEYVDIAEPIFVPSLLTYDKTVYGHSRASSDVYSGNFTNVSNTYDGNVGTYTQLELSTTDEEQSVLSLLGYSVRLLGTDIVDSVLIRYTMFTSASDVQCDIRVAGGIKTITIPNVGSSQRICGDASYWSIESFTISEFQDDNLRIDLLFEYGIDATIYIDDIYLLIYYSSYDGITRYYPDDLHLQTNGDYRKDDKGQMFDRIGGYDFNRIIDSDSDLPEAWGIEQGDGSIVVGVIDGGIVTVPSELTNVLDLNLSYNFYKDQRELTIYSGNLHHGCIVSSIIAAERNNTSGFSGYVKSKIALLQTFGDGAAITNRFPNALIYAADNDIPIVNMSFLYGGTCTLPNSILFNDAIEYFYDNGGGDYINGGVLVAAAGNTNGNIDYLPACNEHVLSVTAVNDYREFVTSYTRDETVDLTSYMGYCQSCNDTYGYGSGTSSAAPVVASLAALIASYKPGVYTNAQIYDIIKRTTDNYYIYGSNSSYAGLLGTGNVNFYEALLLASTPAPVCEFSADIRRTSKNVTITFMDLSTNTPYEWLWTITPATYSFVNGTTSSSQNPEVQFTEDGKYTISLHVFNGGGSDTKEKVNYITISDITYINGKTMLFVK